MDSALWVQVVSTLGAALIGAVPGFISLRLERRRALPQGKVPSRAKRRMLWGLSAFTAAAATVATGLLAPPLGWVVTPAVYVAAMASAAVAKRRRDAKLPLLAPEVQEFAQRHIGVGGFSYDPESLPSLIRIYTDHELTDTSNRDSQDRFQQSDLLANGKKPSSRRLSIEAVLTDRMVKNVVVTGEAGVGKTSLLTYLAHSEWQDWKHRTARNKAADNRLQGLLPVQIAARDIVGKESVAEAFGKDAAARFGHPPASKAKWLIMIDALDEITDAADRTKVEELVFGAMGEGWPCKFMLTTRGLNDSLWKGLHFHGATEFRLQPFTDEQLFNFLVAHQVSSRAHLDDPAVRAAVEAKAVRFFERMESAGGLLELLRLPLLARVAATIYFDEEGRDEIPARRVDIYSEGVEHWLSQFHKRLKEHPADWLHVHDLLRRWAESDLEDSPSELKVLRAFLSELALRHLEHGTQSIPDIACEMLKVRARPKGSRNWKAVLAMLESTGLVHEVDTEQPKFLHKTFAEFLAAPLFKDRYTDVKTLVKALENLDERPAAVFAFNQLNPAMRRDIARAMASELESVIAAGWLAAEGLCVTGDTDQADTDTCDVIIDALFERIPPSLRSDTDWYVVVTALGSMERTKTHLFEAVYSDATQPHQRTIAAATLAVNDPRGIEALRNICADPGSPPFTRVDAAIELARFDPDTAAAALLMLSQDPKLPLTEHIRAAAYLPSLDLHGQMGILRLTTIIADTTIEGELRVTAGEALAQYDSALGLPWIRSLALDKSQSGLTRVGAARVVAQSEPQSAGLDMLAELASDPELDYEDRVSAAYELLQFDVAGAELLRGFATDPEVRLYDRITAAWCLADQQDPKGLDLLCRIAFDATVDGPDRYFVAQAINAHDQPMGETLLRNLAIDWASDPDTRHRAAVDLAAAGDTLGVETLAAIIADESIDFHDRAMSAEALARFDRTAAVTFLQRAAEDRHRDDRDRATAAQFLQQLAEPAGAAVLRSMTGDPDVEGTTRLFAARYLIEHHWRLGVDALLAIVGDPGFEGFNRLSAAQQVEFHSPNDAIAAYQKLVNDTDLSEAFRSKASRHLALLLRTPPLESVEPTALA